MVTKAPYHFYCHYYLVVSQNRDPKIDSPNTIVLILGTLKKVALIWGNHHFTVVAILALMRYFSSFLAWLEALSSEVGGGELSFYPIRPKPYVQTRP